MKATLLTKGTKSELDSLTTERLIMEGATVSRQTGQKDAEQKNILESIKGLTVIIQTSELTRAQLVVYAVKSLWIAYQETLKSSASLFASAKKTGKIEVSALEIIRSMGAKVDKAEVVFAQFIQASTDDLKAAATEAFKALTEDDQKRVSEMIKEAQARFTENFALGS